MARYLILGAGRFGCLALQRLKDRQAGAEFCLVDHDSRKLEALPAYPGIRTVMAPAAAFLADSLAGATTWPDWIIPAIPHHVAIAWLWLTRPPGAAWRQIPVPLAVGQDLPYVYQGTVGELYLSLSTAQCPDDCLEPGTKCFLSGAPRECNLYEYLEKISLTNYTSLVIRSRQLAPGVGGYRPGDLWQLRRQVLRVSGKLLISTACRCHGVTHGLEKPGETEAGVGI